MQASAMIQYRTLSDGTEVALPIRYIDNRCLAATFLTDLERAAHVLEGTGLQAVPQEDGKAVVLYLCWEYRQTDLGPCDISPWLKPRASYSRE